MNQFTLYSMLLSTAIICLVIALFIQVPGPTILLLSFIPLVYLLAISKPGENTRKLAVLAMVCSIPPYLAAGPILSPFKSDRETYYFPLVVMLPGSISSEMIRDYYDLWETGWHSETE